MDNIQKTFFGYWDGNPLSYMNYLTVVSFKNLNPEWQIIIYMPLKKCQYIGWNTPEQKDKYIGKDYLNELKNICEIRIVDFDKIGFKNDINEVIKSDYLRY